METVGIRRTLIREVQTAESDLREVEKERRGHPELQQTLLERKEIVATHIEKLCCFDYRDYMIRALAERDKAGTLLAWLANPAKRGQ